MASELPVLRDDHGRALRIGPTQEGAVGINVADGMRPVLVVLSGERLDAVREAIDRAAMPGQRELPRAAKCPRCGLPGGTAPAPGAACEHAWHQWRPQAGAEATARA